MIQIVKKSFYWWLDYLYVFRKQFGGLLRRDSADSYRNAGGEPVLLIPGVYENWRFIRPIAKLLHAEGFDVHVVDGLGYNRGTIEAMAEVVQKYIVEHELRNVLVVAHSKGGLVGQYLLTLISDRSILKGLIAINTPFSGSKYAYLLPFRSLRIFVPHSKILKFLALNRTVNNCIVSIYGQFDPHIPGGSKLEGAKNVQLPTYGHFRIINDSRVHKAILLAISNLK